MIDKKDIRIVHVEASSRCNSHCPMCSRFTGTGFIQPDLVEGDITADIFYKLFTKEFSGQLEHVYFSGVYGDPCLNKLLPEFVKYLIDNGCKSVSIDTNGGYRNEDWWSSLAHPNVLINFALDGTDNETLGRYRIGVSYDKVITNLRAFTSAGGKAQWNFIVFEHNEHQVETAKTIAEEVGAKFRIKVTQKFRSKSDFKIMKDGKHIDTLYPPKDEKYRHTNIGTVEHVPVSVFNNFKLSKYSHLNKNTVDCKSLARRELYLAANGTLLPCCYLGTYTHDSPGSWQLNQLYDLNKFNLNSNDVDSIINSMYAIKDKWTSTVEDGNLITCLQTCGENHNLTLYHTDTLNKETILDQ